MESIQPHLDGRKNWKMSSVQSDSYDAKIMKTEILKSKIDMYNIFPSFKKVLLVIE